jgi:excisionase family DNA binding protein
MDNLTSDTDRLLDLKSLSEHSSLGVPTLRDYLRSGGLPYFKLRGKILVRLSEFDQWLESFRVDSKQELDSLVAGVMDGLKGEESNK